VQLLDLLLEISRMLLFLDLILVFLNLFITTNFTMKLYFHSICIDLLSCRTIQELYHRLFITQKLKKSQELYLDSSNLLWVLEDSGNENEIYGLNFENGTIEKTTIETQQYRLGRHY
jgi:hypothetical protein